LILKLTLPRQSLLPGAWAVLDAIQFEILRRRSHPVQC
jgi:hypothetical protein